MLFSWQIKLTTPLQTRGPTYQANNATRKQLNSSHPFHTYSNSLSDILSGIYLGFCLRCHVAFCLTFHIVFFPSNSFDHSFIVTCHTVWAVQARRLGDFAYSTTMYGHLLGTTGQMLCEDGEQAGDDDLASGVCLKHVNGCKRCIQHYPTILRWNFIIRLPHGDMSQFLSPRVHLPKYFRGCSWGGPWKM